MSERSFLAGAAAPVIRLSDSKRKFVDKDACSEYISAMAKINLKPYKLPKAAARSGNVEEHTHGGMKFFTITPDENASESDTILYLHGGSYFAPPNIFHWDMLTRISAISRAKIYVPIYPRAPIHTCSAAYNVLDSFCDEYFSDISGSLVFMGDSAGGGLALGLAKRLADERKRSPDKLILISPWLDISMENPETAEYEDSDPVLGIYGLKRFGRLWAGNLDTHDPMVSPIYGDPEGLGEISIFIGTREIFYPEVMRFSRLLDERGIAHRVIVGEGMTHVWPSYPMREGRQAIEDICRCIGDGM